MNQPFDRILVPGRNCHGIFEVKDSGLLIDGWDYYLAFYLSAKQATRYILISGWQFDTEVELLRGKDADLYGTNAPFIPFLNQLCEENKELEVYILAWDFSAFFALEREWFQEWIINLKSCERLHFRFDKSHAFAASHHQKFVVIDNDIAFVGGTDICAHRWDDRCHLPFNPLRKDPDGEIYGPYHEIQTYVTGAAVRHLTSLFQYRWEMSGAERLLLKAPGTGLAGRPSDFRVLSRRAGVSCTFPRTVAPSRDAVQEIRSLYVDAISSSRELIYCENQFFSSRAVFRAFMERMSRGPRLAIVIILPRDPGDWAEEIAVGFAQAKILRSLAGTAAEKGHSLGVYYTTSVSGNSKADPVYIHSKLMVVDDRFLTAGSANFTNRSLGLDSELNLSWEAGPDETEAVESIRRIRVSLLSEHSGLGGLTDCRKLASAEGLVDFLDEIAGGQQKRLRRHPMLDSDDGKWLNDFVSERSYFDPEKTLIDENLFELIAGGATNVFAKGITMLNAWFEKQK